METMFTIETYKTHHRKYDDIKAGNIKPFLKWAGCKGQLLSEIRKYYPFDDININKYAEPFIGGAVLFDILNQYSLKEIYISDINQELINTYKVIQSKVNDLISLLKVLESKYINTDTQERQNIYLKARNDFNNIKLDKYKLNTEKAALFIFLNKTCFNGLYRVNKQGLFNVPMGAYKKPIICNSENLYAVSNKIQNINIVYGDYSQSADFIDKHTFVYFDPPYRPLTKTSSFTAYSENNFDDSEQIRLADFVNKIHSKGAKILISNSDPTYINQQDLFFHKLYSSYKIHKVHAARMINSKVQTRGKITELLITNYV